MKRVQYIVVMRRKKWFVIIQTKHRGPYKSKVKAIECALKAARDVPHSQVLVEEGDGEDRKFMEWNWRGNPPGD